MPLMTVKLLFFYFIVVHPGISGVDAQPNSTTNVTIHTDPDASWSHSNGTYERSDYYDHVFIFAEIVMTIVIPLLVMVGVCGNVVILVVWSAESAFNPSTFLMKCLAVSDMILLGGVSLFVFSFRYQPHMVTAFLSMTIVLCFRIVSAHTTLAVVMTRWIAVYKPLQVRNLLTKRCVVKGYALLMVWCLTAVLPVVLVAVGIVPFENLFTVANIVEVVYIAVPILLLVVLNASLVYKVYTQRVSCNVGQQNTTAHAARSSLHHRLLIAVLCVSVTTVLAYPLGVASRIYVNLNPTYLFLLPLFIAVSVLLESFNSAINVVYYLVFISRFRQLFCHRCCCLRCQATRHQEETGCDMVHFE